ncbi:CapA family protein [Priestia flexa]|uniref:CapA family protein n=1 Tax=Priestia flexa TaxID=86664 RepID=UPI00211AFDB3
MEERTGRKQKYRRMKKRGVFTILALLLMGYFVITNMNRSEPVSKNVASTETEQPKKEQKEEVKEKKAASVKNEKETTIKISAAGDFTLGTDESFPYQQSFPHEADKNGLPYFVEHIKDLFENDDFTTVNLETTLTNSTQKAAKTFRFKGDPSYVNILKLGNIEAVNLANNHIFDYLDQGYEDTMKTLDENDIGYFGYDNEYITEVKGVKIGALGYEGWDSNVETAKKEVKAGIKRLRKEGAEIVIVHYHWGIEKSPVPTQTQQELARYTIDNGADLILGHHPHVVQGIEEYKGKFIVYSLGNFMFGGNRNPSDKDTFVFQQTFHLKGGELTNKKEIQVIPFSISSVASRNNYQPAPLQGAEASRVKNKIINLSAQITGSNWLVYEGGE